MLRLTRLTTPATAQRTQHQLKIGRLHTSAPARSEARSQHVSSEENTEWTPFEFTEENMKKVKAIIAKYPRGYQQAATIPLLHLAQDQHGGWLPVAAMNKVAKILDIPPMQVYEVASFYTMFNRTPVGKHLVQVCTTTPCMLRGAYEILDTCKQHLNIEVGDTTPDKVFTLIEVECAGACVNAPVMAVDKDYYVLFVECDPLTLLQEDLTPETTVKVLEAFKKGEKPKRGPQVPDRKTCEPRGGKTTLLEPPPGPFAREGL